jgi:hypothetical protein
MMMILTPTDYGYLMWIKNFGGVAGAKSKG